MSDFTPEVAEKMRAYAAKMKKKYEGKIVGERLVKIVTREVVKKFNIKFIPDERGKLISFGGPSDNNQGELHSNSPATSGQ